MNYLIFAGLLFVAVTANYFLRFDVDARQKGESLRDWKAKATYPKSFVHALEAFALMMFSATLGIHTIAAALIVFAGMLAFEWSQRFVDWMDVIANAVGILVAIGLPVVIGAVL